MKIQSSEKNIFDFTPDDRRKEERYKCPECHSTHGKGKEKQKDMAWDNSTNRGYCHRCQIAFFEYKFHSKEKDYFVPTWKNITKLSDKAVEWFNSRMISQETLRKMKVYTDRNFMPQIGKEVEVICFPYFVNDKLVNIKFRGANKSFMFIKGAQLAWYNFNCISKFKELIIVEGEPDLLTFINAGFDNVISVPNGAGNVDFLTDSIEQLEHIEKFYLCVDNDLEGLKLKDELIRRFGSDRCYLVNLKECKDANEFVLKYSYVDLKQEVKEAKEIKINGAISINDIKNDVYQLYKNGVIPGFATGNQEIDDYITFETGLLWIVTGIPSSGKSEFVDYVLTLLNLKHNWKAAYFTPENYPLKYHVRKVFNKLVGKDLDCKKVPENDYMKAIDYINDNFFYVLDEDNLTYEKILEIAKYYVKVKGIKVLVIDPYNVIDHQYQKGESETQYISKFLDTLKKFAAFNNVLVVLIAHPAKLKHGENASLYSISGSAHFYNKADIGTIVERQTDENNIMINESFVYWKKVRFGHLGKQGISKLIRNYNNGRYENIISGVNNWDNSNWLMKDYKEHVKENLELTSNINFEFESEDMPF